MFSDILQPTHLLFVLLVALLVLGPKRIPEVARSLGDSLRDFRAAISGEHGPDEHQDEIAVEHSVDQGHGSEEEPVVLTPAPETVDSKTPSAPSPLAEQSLSAEPSPAPRLADPDGPPIRAVPTDSNGKVGDAAAAEPVRPTDRPS
jgi:sec-independent protein translocase protein TatA